MSSIHKNTSQDLVLIKSTELNLLIQWCFGCYVGVIIEKLNEGHGAGLILNGDIVRCI